MESQKQHLFVYGTLQDSEVFKLIAEQDSVSSIPAKLKGFDVFYALDANYPVLSKNPQSTAPGTCFFLSRNFLWESIDAFEDTYTRQLKTIETEDGKTVEAYVYIGHETEDSSRPFNFEQWQKEHKEGFFKKCQFWKLTGHWSSASSCRLCSSKSTEAFYQDKSTAYWKCGNCGYIYQDEKTLLSKEAEKKIYDYHENSIEDQNYVQFLRQLLNPIIEHTKKTPPSLALDYGSGPEPVLAQLMEREGIPTKIYDPFYAPDTDWQKQQYDLIVSTEVVEHVKDLGRTLAALNEVLKPGGLLAIMSDFYDSKKDFQSWHYKNDPTHIGFLNEVSLKWIASHFQYEMNIVGGRVALFHKVR